MLAHKNLSFISLFLFFIFFIINDTNASSFEISPVIYYFDYEEFNTFDVTLDKEEGYLPGIKFKFSQPVNSNRLIIYTSLYDGTVDYTGGTQSGLKHTTRTNEQFFQLGFELVTKKIKPIPGQFIFGIRHFHWDRDILDNNNILGLHEIYTWNELSIGLTFTTDILNDSYYWASITALHTFNANIEVFLENTSENLKIDNNPGFRIHAGKSWLQNKHVSYSVSIITEYWEFGRSNSIFTDDFFGSSVFLTEPRSESLHTGLEFSYAYHF